MIRPKQKQGGFTLIETLIYLATFIIVSGVIISLILSTLETSRQVAPFNSLSRSAVSVLEIMTREIRTAITVDTDNSVFGTSTGSLKLNTLTADDRPRTIRFYLDSGVIELEQDGALLGPLNSSEVTATALIFNQIISSSSPAIKIELDLSSGNDKYQRSEKFYSTVKLRSEN